MRTDARAGWFARICTPAVLVGTLSLAAVVGVYWYMALRPGTNPALVPTPPTIVKALSEEMASGDLLVNTIASLKRVVIGFCIRASLALVLGALAGWFRYAGYVLNRIIDALRPIPALAYIPLVIVARRLALASVHDRRAAERGAVFHRRLLRPAEVEQRMTREDFRASLEYQVKFFMDLGQIKTAPDLGKAIVTDLL